MTQWVWGLFKTRLSVSSCACVEYWSAEYCLVNEQHWWFHESVSLERANRFVAASKGMKEHEESLWVRVRTQPVFTLTTSGYTECTDVRAIMLKSHPVVSWVEDKSFHQRNICLTWVLSRLLLFCLGFSLSCLSVLILRFNGRRHGRHVCLDWSGRLQQFVIAHLTSLSAFGIIWLSVYPVISVEKNNKE